MVASFLLFFVGDLYCGLGGFAIGCVGVLVGFCAKIALGTLALIVFLHLADLDRMSQTIF